MTKEEYKEWLNDNAIRTETLYENNVCYELATMKDGWIGIFEHNELTSCYYPVIQARDMNHAKSYCAMTEQIDVPFQVL